MVPATYTMSLVEAYAASWIEMYTRFKTFTCITVEAYAASWIEIDPTAPDMACTWVEAYAVSWIEIKFRLADFYPFCGRSLCGFVD